MFGKLGPLEIGLILLIILIVFGAGKLPQVGQALGKSIKEFKKASKGEDEETEKPKTEAAKAEEQPAAKKS
jgi:sec-independent protein translocase protein TatA